MKIRNAFTMIELIFVIVIMGIIGKFGTEILVNAYNSFITSTVNNTLQSNSGIAVEFIASRLQHRIKDSVIARTGDGITPVTVSSINPTDPNRANYIIVEWVEADVDGFRGTTAPLWSGIVDLNPSTSVSLISPSTDTGAVSTLINQLSYGTKTIADAALYFINSNSDVNGYGWNASAVSPIPNQTFTMHPINSNSATAQVDDFTSSIAGQTFAGAGNIYEYYQLAWTANALVYTAGPNNMGTLTFYYNYQPWNGQNYKAGRSSILMEGVSTFQFMSIDSIMKIQVCAKSDLLILDGGDYSLCKEKTIL